MIVTTAGSAAANSYASAAEADQYDDNRPAASSSDTWATATATQKTEALLWATKLIDRLVEWTGSAVDATQALQWPRIGMVKPTGFEHVGEMTIPQELKDATSEYARQLIADATRTDDYEVESKGIKSLRAGPVTLEFSSTASAKALPDAVLYLLPPDWVSSVRGRASSFHRLVRA